ncbi:DgyrCDS3399 [Dimorphilus gyrociliatus]|uniref:DgyrCDS3399 n=3 Tax=Dimorphilus gyrociliatus TaxID=2664684 RepID=A0A7I8VF16_9ANNE|nr:DgyrCDS3399 [Dimorphilus gyrociliatus]
MFKIFAIIMLINNLNCRGEIGRVLKYYETLTRNDFTLEKISRTKRQTESPTFSQKLNIRLFGKNLQLHVNPEKNVMSKDFQSFVKSTKHFEEKYIEHPKFYKGYVKGLKKSTVRIHFIANDVFAAIDLPEEHIFIEPSWKFLPLSSNYSLIAYRTSQLSSTDRLKCGFVDPNLAEEPKNQHVQTHRAKRNTIANRVCKLLLVADYKYFVEVGKKSFSETVNNMISKITEVDAIYRATDFRNGYKNIGFEIQTVVVHDEFTKNSGENHYNKDKSNWTAKELLRAFGSDKSLKHENYCAAHLFTATKFSDGIQGVAWIAKSGAVGGICAPGSGSTKYNTGWSTAIDKYGNRILTFESILVAAHELGHNFGSQHDPPSCATDKNNLFLMYTYAVSGKQSNNQKFSQCSIDHISKVLNSRGSSCLKEPSTSFCGNYKKEDGEDCDVGNVADDKCCTTNCKFKTNAVCSDRNSPCCFECTYANSSVKCLDQSNVLNCKKNSFCTGKSPECPDPKFEVDGSSCIDSGKCKKGSCQPFCESLNKNSASCLCANENSCSICCSVNNGTCEVHRENGKKLLLSDGRPCFEGICEKGICQKTKPVVNKLWDILKKLSVNDIIEFFKKNLVLMVIIFFSVIYIPITIIISCIDYKRKEDEKSHRRWKYEMPNQIFLSNSDKLTIKATRSKRRDNYMVKKDEENQKIKKEKVSKQRNKVHPSNTNYNI